MHRGSLSRRHPSAALAAVVAALAALAALLVATTPAQAATSGALRGVASNRCLDVLGADQTDGTYLQIYDCWGGTNQQWQWSGSRLVARHSGKCLDVVGSGTGDGVDVSVYTCHSGTNQQWTRVTS